MCLKSKGTRRATASHLHAHDPGTAGAMLACARIGAIHPSCLAGSRRIPSRAGSTTLSATSRDVQRVPQVGSISNSGHADEASRTRRASRNGCREGHRRACNMVAGRDTWFHDEIQKPLDCKPETMNAEDNLFILYTSGQRENPRAWCIPPPISDALRSFAKVIFDVPRPISTGAPQTSAG